MTKKEARQFNQMHQALTRICAYETPSAIARTAMKNYGLNPDEAVAYAYENVRSEARAGIKGVRAVLAQEGPRS